MTDPELRTTKRVAASLPNSRQGCRPNRIPAKSQYTGLDSSPYPHTSLHLCNEGMGVYFGKTERNDMLKVVCELRMEAENDLPRVFSRGNSVPSR